jgi:integrase
MRGSIQRRGAHSWRIRFDLETDAQGQRRTVSRTIRGKRVDAERELAKLVNAVHDGVHVDPSKLTVVEHLRSWLDGPHGLAGKTLERYRELVEQQIGPLIGETPLQKLRPAHVADWHARLLRGGGKHGRPLSPRTVMSAHRVLHRGLELALKTELIARNVAHAIDPPKVEQTEVESLKADQVGAMLAALKSHWLEPIVITALSTGARRGEILGLSWGSVDLAGGWRRLPAALSRRVPA